MSPVTLDGAQLAAVSYDSAGQLPGVAYGPAGAPVTTLGSVTRNPAGAVTGQTWTVGSRTLGESLTRSQAGRITKSVATDSVGPASTVDWSYGYDPVGRLTSAVLAAAGTRPTVTLGYGYAASGGCGADPAAGLNGSRTSMSRQLGTATPAESTVCTDNASRVTSVASSTGGLTVSPATVTYDAHGNLTQLGTQSWKYDGADRVSSTTANGITPSLSVYVRDTLGRVVASGPDGSPTRYGFTSTDDSPDFQLTPTNALRERYVTLPGGVLYTKGYAAPSLTSWAITNLHGDTIATITGTTVTAGYVYDPFGQPINTSSGAVDLAATPTTRTGTTTDAWHGGAQRGYEHTSGLNQILMGARTYLPELGIFTATDPIEGGNTTTYTYPQDPINGEDLDGRVAKDPSFEGSTIRRKKLKKTRRTKDDGRYYGPTGGLSASEFVRMASYLSPLVNSTRIGNWTLSGGYMTNASVTLDGGKVSLAVGYSSFFGSKPGAQLMWSPAHKTSSVAASLGACYRFVCLGVSSGNSVGPGGWMLQVGVSTTNGAWLSGGAG